MPAPKNNTYWQNRQTHGRPSTFPTPQEFEQAWIDYFNWVDKHPWHKKEAIKSGPSVGKLVRVPTKRPYTIVGFCAFHGLGMNYIAQMEKGFKDSPNEDFSVILLWAKGICYADKFEGAAIGAYNHMIIARDLGLKEISESTLKGDKENPIAVQTVGSVDYTKLSKEVLTAIRDARIKPEANDNGATP